MKDKISLVSLVLLIVAAIDSIRTLPTTALFGTSLIFFYVLSAIIFLIPVAFLSAEFSSRFPEQGGVFHWIKHAFGERYAVLAVWLQWINTMVWYPTMLLFISGTTSYLIEPSIANNKIFLLTFSLILFWSLTIINMKGLKISARINSFCGTVGTLIPMCFLIVLGFWHFYSSDSIAISLSWSDLIPSFDFKNSSIALVTIMASFLGMELAGVHVNDIQNPQKNFPKAIGYSVAILLGTLIFGALAIAIVIPKSDIHFVDGVMQTFTAFLINFNMEFLIPVLALLIIIGSTGGSVNWLLSPAKSLLQVAEHGFLPTLFKVKNKHGVPWRILFLQAMLVSIFCLALQLVPDINTYYWFLMALSTGLYMLMYILLFLAALKIKRCAKGYKVPKGIRTFSYLIGLLACVLTMIVGFEPPPSINIESKFQYGAMIGLGFCLMIMPVRLLWLYRKKNAIPMLGKIEEA